MIKLIMGINIMISAMFLGMKHPMSMGLTLMIQTILVTIITGISSSSYWFSYIMFLIMISGMMVLFMYMTSIASNEMFYIKFNSKFIWAAIAAILAMTLFEANMNLLDNMNEIITSSKNDQSLFLMYNFPSSMMTILLMNYLLITLVVVVKITNFSAGPLRQSN